MAQESAKNLLERFSRSKSIKQQWIDLYGDAYEYALPQRNQYFDTGNGMGGVSTQGRKRVDRVFASTAQASTIAFANRIQTDMMPPFQQWQDFVPGALVPENRKDEVKRILDKVKDIFFAVLHSSGFDMANNEVLLDLAIGTGAMLTLPGSINKPVLFIAVPGSQVTLESGPWGTVSAIYRNKTIKIRNIAAEWPDAKLPPDMIEALKASQDAETQVLEVTYGDAAKMAQGDDTTWYYEVLNMGTAEKPGNEKLVERELTYNPWVTPRWIKVAGEDYGRGPVIQALPDIKTENKISEFLLKNLAIQIAGVYTGVSGGQFNPLAVNIHPGAVIPVDSNGSQGRGATLQALTPPGNVQLADLELQRLEDRIKGFLLDSKLPPDNSAKVRSATEIIERIKELAKDIGSPFGRLITEYIQPLSRNVLKILAQRNLIPEIQLDGLAADIQMLSPLAREQDLNEVEALVRALTVMSQFGNEIFLAKVKVEEAIPKIGELMGVDPNLIRTDEESGNMEQLVAGLIAKQVAEQAGNGSLQAPGSDGTIPTPEAATTGLSAVA